MKKSLFIMVALLLAVAGLRAQTGCTAPTGLSADVHSPEWRNALLQWTPVSYAGEEVFGYTEQHPMIYKNGNDFTAVIRIPADSMARFTGKSLTAVRIRPYLLYQCKYYIKVWQGGSIDTVAGTANPGTLLVDQYVDQTLAKRADNDILLSTPVTVNPNQEIWIGLRMVYDYNDGYPMMFDNTVCVNGASNLLYTPTGGWSLASGYAWYLSGIFTNTSDGISYNVYRDNVLISNTSASVFKDSLASDGTYLYEVKALHSSNCESAAITETVVMNDSDMIVTLPYFQDFDGVTGNTGTTLASHVLPAGWSWVNHGTTYPNYPTVYLSSTYASSGTNALRFHNYNTTANSSTYSDQYAILPPIDVTAHPINTLQMEFNARKYATTSTYYARLVVGVMSSLWDVTTFEPYDTLEITDITHAPFVVNFGSYSGNGRYIAMKVQKPDASGTQYNSVVVDDLFLDVIPTCQKPSNLTLVPSAATQTSLTVDWVENGTAVDWEIEYAPYGSLAGTASRVMATSHPYTLVGLYPGTVYDIRVRAVCNAGDTSRYSNELMASTLCGTITNLPYYQDFDAFSGLTTTTASSTNLGQFCWSQMVVGSSVSATSNYRGYPIVYANTTYSQSGLNALRFYSYTTSTTYGDEYGILPPIDVTAYPMNTLQIEFSAARASTYAFNFEVGIMSDSTDASTFVPMASFAIPTTVTSQQYNDYLVDFSSYTGTGRFIAFRMLKPASGYLLGYIDDVKVSVIPNCKRPMYVTVGRMTDQSVDISWTPIGDETAWDLAVVPHGDPIDVNTTFYAMDSFYHVTGLTANTEYDVYVRANCGNEVSLWTAVETFTTYCSAISTIPYTENFDSYPATTAVASGVIPTCWTRNTNNTSPYPYIYSTQHASGTGSLYFYATSAYHSLAATQMLDLSAYQSGELMLSFKALKTSSTSGYGRIQVGVMTDPADLSTFTLLKNISTNDFPTLGAWTDFHVVLPNHYTAPVFIAFYVPATGTAYSYIDDVVLDYTPDCMSPTNLCVKNITGTSAKVEWEPSFRGVSEYTVEFSVAGQDLWTAVSTTTSDNCTLHGLEPSTSYDVRVTPLCAAGTAAPIVKTFTTQCLLPEYTQVGTGTSTTAYTPIYTAYQYGYSQQLYRANEDLQNTPMAIDALAFQYSGSGATTRTVDIYLLHTLEADIAAWIPTTNAQLVFSGDVELLPNASDNGWITIPLDSSFQYDGMSNLLVAIYTHNATLTNTVSTDKVFKYTSLSNMTRYLYNTGTTTYNPLDVSSLTAGTSSSYRPNIRFIHCNTNSICASPYLAVSDLGSDNVSLEWQAGYQENTWELEYKTASSATWVHEGTFTSVTSHTITNLMPNTDYMVRLRAVCTDTSAWVTESFRTACYPLATVPFVEDFENADGSGTGHFVPCWTTLTNATSSYPYTSTTTSYVHSGSYGTYFYATTAYYSLAATPRFDDNVQMDSLQIRFWAKKSSDAYFIEVGMMSNPYDYDSFELLERLSPDTVNVWQELSLTTSGYTGNGRRIAFRLPSGATDYMYVDDITISYISPCSRVSDLYAASVTNNTANIHWVPNGDETNWFYTYGIADSVDITTAVTQFTTDTMVSISNLLGNTSYDFYVISDCGGGELSDPMKITFTTLCDPITSLPFITNFDDLGGTGSANYPDCWSKLYMSTATTAPITTSYPYPSSTYYASAPYAMYFFNNITATQTYSIASLPEFDASIPVNTLQADFDLLKISNAYYMLVGVMTDPADPTTFVTVDTVRCDTIKVFEHKAVSLASYTGNGRYLSFKSCGDGLYLDNLRVDLVPQCDAPTQFEIRDIHTTDFTLSWHPEGNETSWEVYVLPARASLLNAVPIIVQTDTFYQVTNLTAATQYDVYLRAICPGGTGYSSFLFETVATACDAITTLPYTEDFEREEGATSGSVNNLPLCWNYFNTTTVASYLGYPIIYRGSSYANSGNNSLRFYVYTPSTYSDQIAVLPAINTTVNPINGLQLSCNLRKYSTSYPYTMAIVGVMTDPTQDSTFVPVDTIVCTSLQYERKIAYLDRYTGTGSYIAIKVPKILTLTYNSCYIDDIEINHIAGCRRVEDLHITHIASDALTVAWTPRGSETSWLVQYKPTTDTVWNDLVVSAPTAPISSLLPNTSYDVRVFADCNGSYSEGSLPIVATTDCIVLGTLPYTTNLDDVAGYNSTTGTTNNLPPCWHQFNTGSSSDSYVGYPIVYNSSSDANTGSNSIRFYSYVSGNTYYGDQWAILPGLDVNTYSLNTLQLKFNAKKYSNSYPFNLIVGVMSDVLDPSTFVPVDTISPATNAYEPCVVYFNHYTGAGHYIAMMIEQPISSYNAGYVDDIEISVAPSCLPVSDVRLVSANSTEITVEWDVNGAETDWIVSYVQFGDTVWTSQSVSGTPTATVQNLTPNTPYYFRVQADCGNGDVSETSLPILARTECALLAQLPFSENFDGVQGSTSGSVNNLPDCWNHLSGTYASYAGYPIVYSTASYAQSTPNSLRFYTYTGTTDYGDQYAILPPIDPSVYPINTLRMRFAAREGSTTSTYDFRLVIGVMTDPDNATTFVPVDTFDSHTTSYVNDTVYFANYSGNGMYIALKAPRNSGNNYNTGHVDNIVVEVAPVVCNTPTNVAVSGITSSAATVTWTPGGSETHWNLQYREASGNWSNNIAVANTPSYNLTGLTDSTTYVVRVQSACTAIATSDWSDTLVFTTPVAVTPPTVTTQAASNIGETTATLNGAVNAGTEAITAQGFEWKATVGGTYVAVNATGTTMTYDLAGLTAGTGYTFRAFATTASGTTYGDEMTFTTEAGQQTCLSPTDVTVTDIDQTSAKVSWTQPGNTANSWTVQYKESGASSWNSVSASALTHTLTGLTPETSYDVQVIANCTNGLTSDPSVTANFTTLPDGINDHTLDNTVTVYPNPTTGLVQIKNGEWRMENVEVYDAYGKLLYEMNVNDHTANLDLSGYAKGTYFVRVTTEKGVVTKRVVKN
ncbi:MAG: fibronectin type III domain-containing protein [Bacteroidales bacterium]|nr:fibronectin type III domain-containing protein [Bacteroidales bacterium]